MDRWGNLMPRNKWKPKQGNPKSLGSSKSTSTREVYRNTVWPQEIREISNNLSLLLKQLEKEKQIKPKVSKKNEITKIMEEINEIRHEENNLKNTNETKS